MSIENRINKVDLQSEEEAINSDYRAAIHKKFSEADVRPETIRQLVFEDFAAPLDSRLTEKLQHIHERILEDFPTREMITLSPLGVTGLDRYLTKTSALKIAHITGRPADVVADPTIQLAVETFRKRRSRNEDGVRLGAIHMCARLQNYSDERLKPVFEMFGTLDSSITSSDEFEAGEIVNLIGVYVGLLRSLGVTAR